ncbi:MAG: peptidase T [Prolixibacteraceae bacterium]
MDKVIERFIGYAKEHTTSDPKSKASPTTSRQLVFAGKLADELKSIGLKDVEKDKNGYVTATLPANCNEPVPVVGFIAHMDTSPDFPGESVTPRFFTYTGGDIVLNERIVLSPAQFPDLENYIGQQLIIPDGTTLLGADDKAGIAEIVTAMEYLLAHPEIKHGRIRVCFTPDEEVGKGAANFDVAGFGAAFAYTLDGGEIGELEYENFNAATATVTIQGRSVHPGAAKNKMINAIHVGQKLNYMLPAEQRPEYTEKREGFFHCIAFEGRVEKAEITYLIRDHDRKLFDARKQMLTQACLFLNDEFGEGTVQLDLEDQYYNMREKIEPVRYIVDLAEEAMRDAGIVPKIRAIRGGTDGAGLSYKGLPCPNIFAGGHNFHGPYEYIPVNSMKKAVEVIVRIAEKVVSKL